MGTKGAVWLGKGKRNQATRKQKQDEDDVQGFWFCFCLSVYVYVVVLCECSWFVSVLYFCFLVGCFVCRFCMLLRRLLSFVLILPFLFPSRYHSPTLLVLLLVLG